MERSLKQGEESCQYNYPDLYRITSPDPRTMLPLRRYWWSLKRYVWYVSILGPVTFASRTIPSTKIGKTVFKNRFRNVSKQHEALNLKKGDWVEVRSAKEIFSTLNEEGKLKGLRFTREMMKFCGKRYRVYKKLEKIILEATGELRTIRTPTVLLDGVFCDGKAHGGCDRSCFCFWREAWLKKISPP